MDKPEKKSFFSKLKDKMGNFSPASIDDPMAQQISWQPISKTSRSSRSSKLKTIHSDLKEFKVTLSGLLLPLIFIVVGSLLTLLIITNFINEETRPSGVELFLLPLLSVFIIGVGVLFLSRSVEKIVFDRNKGIYWKGKDPATVMRPEELKNYAKLEEVYALQFISKSVRTSKSSYLAYELNLVLKSGNRLNVVCHGSGRHLHREGQELAEFIGKPFWNGTGIRF